MDKGQKCGNVGFNSVFAGFLVLILMLLVTRENYVSHLWIPYSFWCIGLTLEGIGWFWHLKIKRKDRETPVSRNSGSPTEHQEEK